MTLNSVTPVRSATPGNPLAPDSGTGAGTGTSLFEVLLADAHQEQAAGETGAPPNDDASEAPDLGEHTEPIATPPEAHHAVETNEHPDDEPQPDPKKESTADPEALLAALAALASTPPNAATPIPTPPAAPALMEVEAGVPADARPDAPVARPTLDTTLQTAPPLTDLPLTDLQLTDLSVTEPPLTDLPVVDDTAVPEPAITPEIDVTASLSIVDFPAPAPEPADVAVQLAPPRATPDRAPVVTPRPAAEDPSVEPAPTDDDGLRTDVRTGPDPTRDTGVPDPTRPRPAAAAAAAANNATPIAPPTAPAATAVEVVANEVAVAAAPTAPPPPAEQLVSVLAPLRNTPEGTYSLRLELKPLELGRVEMRVEMRDGVLHASIHADHESSAQLVRASLGELRDLLRSEGVRTGTLTVSDGALGWNGNERRDASQAGRDGSPRPAAAAPDGTVTAPGPTVNPATIESEATSLLDVRV